MKPRVRRKSKNIKPRFFNSFRHPRASGPVGGYPTPRWSHRRWPAGSPPPAPMVQSRPGSGPSRSRTAGASPAARAGAGGGVQPPVPHRPEPAGHHPGGGARGSRGPCVRSGTVLTGSQRGLKFHRNPGDRLRWWPPGGRSPARPEAYRSGSPCSGFRRVPGGSRPGPGRRGG